MNQIDQKFLKFHEANPHIMDKIVHYAMALKAAGRKKYGMKAVIERVRWDYAIKTEKDEKGFKINNNFTSRYARMVEKHHPELKDFFEIRTIESDSMFAVEQQMTMGDVWNGSV